MKKTIIAMMALTAVASAATVDTISKTDQDLLSYLDFTPNANGGFQSAAGSVGYGNQAYLKDGYGLIAGAPDSGAHTMWSQGTFRTTVSTNNFTLSFDVRSFGKGDLLSVGAGWTGSNWDKVTLHTGDDGVLGLKFYDPDNGGAAITVSTGLTSGTRTEWTTITLVGDSVKLEGDDTASNLVYLYVNGVSKGYLNMSELDQLNQGGSGAWLTSGVDGYQFGGAFRNGGTTTAISGLTEIDNVLFYKRALEANEVKALIVPEPTTATLSLLALAGLAARRRRK